MFFCSLFFVPAEEEEEVERGLTETESEEAYCGKHQIDFIPRKNIFILFAADQAGGG